MTEAEWLACDKLHLMLDDYRVRVNQRKLRLFVCACCGTVTQLLGPDSLHALDVAERFADGQVSLDLLTGARDRAREAAKRLNRAREQPRGLTVQGNKEHRAAQAAQLACNEEVARYAQDAAWNCWSAGGSVRLAADPQQGENVFVFFLREIYGNPFRPAPLAPSQRTADVLSLVRAAYEERNLPARELDPLRLAVLADALEEAGCTEQAILDHLRSAGPHVRGCWALDLILGKA